jgi:anti-anti-sigma factor
VSIVLSVTGELDASNADRFDQSLRQVMSAGGRFIVDISDVNFLGVQCIRTFLDVDASCRNERRPWALVIDPALRPLLRVGDRDGVLPVMDSLVEALRDVGVARARVLALVPRAKRAK